MLEKIKTVAKKHKVELILLTVLGLTYLSGYSNGYKYGFSQGNKVKKIIIYKLL